MNNLNGYLRCGVGAVLMATVVGNCLAAAQSDNSNGNGERGYRHVLLLSVDGLHRGDLARWVENNPQSALAQLARHGVTYTNATTTTPSDSFPGLLAQVTGGTPKSTGVYYDDSYDRTLYYPGSVTPGSPCAGDAGTEVIYDETMDIDFTQLLSGGIDPVNLPLAKAADGTCQPLFPHDFLKVNTIFQVARQHGLHTAWSDKHYSYDIVNGPSAGGVGVEDLYTPEINSLVVNGGVVNGVDLSGSLAKCDASNSLDVNGAGKVSVYTDCGPTQEAYDDVKVQAIIHEIDGKRSNGASIAGGPVVPAIFGMNFQAVSVGEKLPVGGYQDAAGTPSELLQHAVAHTDESIGRMVAELRKRNLMNDTLIIVSAKHGQSPINHAKLAMESGAKYAPDQTVQDPLGYIQGVDPNVGNQAGNNPYQTNGGGPYDTAGHLQTDDVGIVWLQINTAENTANVAAALAVASGDMHATSLSPGSIFKDNITYGPALSKIFGDPLIRATRSLRRARRISSSSRTRA